MFQDGFDLFARHTLKPFEEIIHRCTAFKIFEECRYWNPCAFESQAPLTFPGMRSTAEQLLQSSMALLYLCIPRTARAERFRYPFTHQIDETSAAIGMGENQTSAKIGGSIAKRARLELEAKTGKKVVTGENYLPPASAKKIRAQEK